MLLVLLAKAAHRRLGIRTLSVMPATQELFGHTTGRFLYNEDLNLKLRYQPFNVSALEAIACKSVDAQRVVTWKKVGEGSFNKVFLLHFDNSRQAALRIPNPIVPDIHRTTASEVATMQYIRERWPNDSIYPLPPKVIAWDASPDSKVGTPFILADYVEGVSARENWFKPETQGKPVASFIFSATYFEGLMLSEPFISHGALYFADDVGGALAALPLYNDQSHAEKHRSLAEKYRIGPTVQREWSRDVYEKVVAFRGPWNDMQSLIRDAVNLQIQALENGLAFQNVLIRSTTQDEPGIIQCLKMVLSIAELIVPADPAFVRPALNHPDLSLDNMIWSKGLDRLQSLIDWQNAVVYPFCMQAGKADAFIYQGTKVKMFPDGTIPFPDGFDSLPAELQEEVRLEHRLACRDRAHQRVVNEVQHDRCDCWRLPHIHILANIVPAVLRVIADGPAYLRELLLETQEHWEDIVALSANPGSPCPIAFTSEEANMIRSEVAATKRYESNVEALCDTVGCTIDGWIPEGNYAKGKKMIEVLREQWKEDEMGGPFPFKEGFWSPNLT